MLADLIEIKPGSAFEPWLRNELARRADHVCVDSTQEFARYDRAITREGQVKSRDRHEKDDRFRIDDRRQYVLGWTNAAKVDALIFDGASTCDCIQSANATPRWSLSCAPHRTSRYWASAAPSGDCCWASWC